MSNERITLLLALVPLLGLVLVGRLVQLQVGEHDKHEARAEAVRQRTVVVPGRRGDILDRYGVVLARDEPTWEIHLNYWYFTEPRNVAARLERRRGIPGMAASTQETLVSMVNDLAARKDARTGTRLRRFLDTWPDRKTELVQAEIETTLAELAAILDVPVEPMVARIARVVAEVDARIADTGMTWAERYTEIVQIGANARKWGDLARAERAERRKLAEAESVRAWLEARPPRELAPPAYQDNPLILARGVARDAVETVLELDHLFFGVRAEPVTNRVYPEAEVGSHLLGYLMPVDRVGFVPDTPEASTPLHSPHYQRVRQRAIADLSPAFVYRHFGDPDHAAGLRWSLMGEPIGVTGIEQALNAEVEGHFGASIMETDAHQQSSRILAEVEPRGGADLHTTLDAELQRVAQAALEEVYAEIGSPGAVVVMDVRTGEVLALVSSPSFDPNRIGSPRPEDRSYVADLLQNAETNGKPLYNRAIHGAVAAGSIFKVLTGIAVAEEGVPIGPGLVAHVPSTGHWVNRALVGGSGRAYTCHVRVGRALGLSEALERSSNEYFWEESYRLGYDGLRDWAYRFGFGFPTGIEVGEPSGWYTDAAGTPRNRFFPTEPDIAADVVLAAIGQGRLRATPLQVCRFLAAVATRGDLPTPRLIASTAPSSRHVDVSDATWDAIHDGLRDVVHGSAGTARRHAALRRLRVAGKTSTAQTQRLRYDPATGRERELNLAWFGGYAPYDNPRVAIVVYIEDTFEGGSAIAAPIAATILDALAARPDYANAFLPR